MKIQKTLWLVAAIAVAPVLQGSNVVLQASCENKELLNGTFDDDGFGGVLDWGFGRTNGKTTLERLP